MLELDPLSSTLRTSSLTSEPPRKRQRTTDCEPNVATAGTSPAPSPGPFGDVSTSTDATASRSSSTLGWSSRLHTATSPTGNTPESSDVQLGASFVGSGSAPPSGAVAESVSVDAARSGATCQGDLTFVVPNARFRTGGRGNADGSPPSMKGGRKARAKQEYPDDDGGMNREPIQSEPRRHQVSTEGACASDRGFHGTEVGRSNPRDAAGGARAIAASNSPMAMRRQHIVEAVEGPHQIAGPEGEDSGRDLMLVRDGEFYINSADCVIRVEDTLFRVHRYFLGRDSFVFQYMFSMPSESHALSRNILEGCSDENPIRLYGESAERFRALLSVIYDLPLQLQVYNTPAANVDRLLTIAEVTIKYHFVSIEKWAFDALYNAISGLHGPPQERYQLGHCSSAWMKRLLEVALLCGHTRLRDYVVERWVDRIAARDLRPVHALEFADRSGIKRLQGYAYYVQLLEMGDGFDPGAVEDGEQHARSRLALAEAAAAGPTGDNGNASPARARTPAALTSAQRRRLLSGHWSLCRLWETLRASAPKSERPDGCTYHQHGCVSTWTQVWRDVGAAEPTLNHPPGDVLGRLRAMEEQLCTHADLSCALTPLCRRLALMALKSTVRAVEESLAGHFADLTRESLLVKATEEETS